METATTDLYHVFPINDLLEHRLDDPDCWCDPKVEIVGAALVITHNSFDGREHKEDEGDKD